MQTTSVFGPKDTTYIASAVETYYVSHSIHIHVEVADLLQKEHHGYCTDMDLASLVHDVLASQQHSRNNQPYQPWGWAIIYK